MQQGIDVILRLKTAGVQQVQQDVQRVEQAIRKVDSLNKTAYRATLGLRAAALPVVSIFGGTEIATAIYRVQLLNQGFDQMAEAMEKSGRAAVALRAALGLLGKASLAAGVGYVGYKAGEWISGPEGSRRSDFFQTLLLRSAAGLASTLGMKERAAILWQTADEISAGTYGRAAPIPEREHPTEPEQTELRARLQMARDQIDWDYKERLVDLEQYLATRLELLRRQHQAELELAPWAEDPAKAKLAADWAFLAGLQELDQLRAAGPLTKAAQGANLVQAPQERFTNLGQMGLFTTAGEAGRYASSLEVQNNMLSELREINSRLAGGIKVDL